MTRFWQRWLKLWCVGVGIFGLALAGAAFESTDGATRYAFAILGAETPLELTPELRFSIALMGAVTLGWALTTNAVLAVADRLEPSLAMRLWRGAAAAVAVWFVVDSSLSIATGFPLNAVSNAILFVAFLIPLQRSGMLSGQMSGSEPRPYR